MIDHVTGLVCVICGTSYPPVEAGYVCPDHPDVGAGNEGILDVRYDYELIGSRISRDSLAESHDTTMWRYRPLMPVEPARSTHARALWN